MNTESLRGLVENEMVALRVSAKKFASLGGAISLAEAAVYSNIADELESLLTQAPVVNQGLTAEGWVMVPREPTEEMKVSALHRLNPLGALVDWNHDSDEGATRPDVTECWTAMLAAAPPVYYGKHDGTIGVYPAPAAPVAERQPDGWAYRYPDGVIRVSGGREWNAMSPVEAIPYYFGAPHGGAAPAVEVDEAMVERACRRFEQCAAAEVPFDESMQAALTAALGGNHGK